MFNCNYAVLLPVLTIMLIITLIIYVSDTSKSMLMNIPIAVLLVFGLRILFNEVEFQWKVRNTRPISYLSHLEKKQLSVNDSRLSTLPSAQEWKRKIDSPVVEAAIEEFLDKIMHDFVIDLWYSDITPDKEAPELIHAIVMDALGEVSLRIKEVNLVEMLLSDIVDLIGDHIDLFRRNQSAIGRDVMGTLSSEERDERLKHHLMASKELHPALVSPECEYKVMQQLIDGLLAVVLRPREAQCPLVRCIARELLTCLVMQPIMNFASPGYINELIEYIILVYDNGGFKDFATDQSPNVEGHNSDHVVSAEHGYNNQGSDVSLSQFNDYRELESGDSGNLLSSTMQDEPIHPRHADWAKVFEAATQRRTEVLMPENLENMWTIGRNYKKKFQKKAAPELQAHEVTSTGSVQMPGKELMTDVPKWEPETSSEIEDKPYKQLTPCIDRDTQSTDINIDALSRSQDFSKNVFPKGGSTIHELENTENVVSQRNKNKLMRSNSTFDREVQSNLEHMFTRKGSAPIIMKPYSTDVNELNVNSLKSSSDMVSHTGVLHVIILQVIGASFENPDSNSFAVYSICVTDADNTTWFVKRRYRNFERLHKHLKDIPNYTLHLPPKRIFSSSTEDAFVHQRCIQLDKYLQDLLSIANVAEQHEVWDFLSASSKNYSFGTSSSVMTTLAVNVDDAMDDIVRQFKGVSDGLMRMVSGSQSSYEPASSVTSRNLSWNTDDINKLAMRQSTSNSLNSFSDNEEGDKDLNHGQQELEHSTQANGWHSDNELKEDPTGVPPEWTPPNLTVPVLNLVDKVFQLERRGWLRTLLEENEGFKLHSVFTNYMVDELVALDYTYFKAFSLCIVLLGMALNLHLYVNWRILPLRFEDVLLRQVFWISKQILQLVMEDAIDDLLLRQIQWLRREDVIAQGIRWVQDILWPDGTFFLTLRIQEKLRGSSEANQGPQITRQQRGRRVTKLGSFEQQLEAARRASDVKNMIFNGAPTPLVSLIGHKQYRRCARDIYYFLQSTVCLKQLGYGILELVLLSLFPELRDLVRDIHEKMHMQPAEN
ncbi:hypothetical protein DH2020_023855 [Rehmannia glutinosa]|uniref:Sorting nexin-13 n=1 Tax=Rehmannia glutinosa TaxID=99300 RepID=A0ABR0W794_REHGL